MEAWRPVRDQERALQVVVEVVPVPEPLEVRQAVEVQQAVRHPVPVRRREAARPLLPR